MNEQTIQKRVLRITFFTICISILLITCSSTLVFLMQKANKESYDIQLQGLLTEYKINMERQFSSDLQSLETLTPFLDLNFIQENTKNTEQKYGIESPFLTITYHDKKSLESYPILSLKDAPTYSFQSASLETQELINKAFHGERSVSAVHFNQQVGENIITYAIPVYGKNMDTIIGALTATRNTQIFSDILSQSTTSEFSLNVDWIRSDGTFITWSPYSIVEEHPTSAFDDNLITPENQKIIKKKMKKNISFISSSNYKGKEYPLYFYPLKTNGWYLICLDTKNGLQSPIHSIFLAVNLAFGSILVVSIIAIAIFYQLLRKNNAVLIDLKKHDRLTGALNFDQFKEEIEILSKTIRSYSIVAINIRHFQYINEIFGMNSADLLLCKVSEILEKELTTNERYCRYIGDQFYLFLMDTNKDILTKRIYRILDRISKIPLEFNKNYSMSLYSGVIVSLDAAQDEQAIHSLFQKVEFTLKSARSGHENLVVFYDQQMHQQENLYNFIESSMKKALEEEEFKMYLQPKIELKTNHIVGAEALVRWIRSDGTMIYPDQFIPVFERNGFCSELDLYMVEQACKQLRKWIDAGKETIHISVNQSKLLFYQSDYIERLCEITNRYQISPRQITLEILEGLAAKNIDELNKTIAKLHQIGFRISLDDFGSGYSSLNILSTIKIDELKLDRTFLSEELLKRQSQQMMLKNIVQLSKDLHIKTVVEGVETLHNHELIKMLGCNYGQGYYYSRPIPVDKFEKEFLS